MQVVGSFIGVGEEEDFEANFLDGVGELFALVGGVDVDENEVRHGGGELCDYPLPFVVGVYADAVFGFEAQVLDETRG